jgi:hypothetical protein
MVPLFLQFRVNWLSFSSNSLSIFPKAFHSLPL